MYPLMMSVTSFSKFSINERVNSVAACRRVSLSAHNLSNQISAILLKTYLLTALGLSECIRMGHPQTSPPRALQQGSALVSFT